MVSASTNLESSVITRQGPLKYMNAIQKELSLLNGIQSRPHERQTHLSTRIHSLPLPKHYFSLPYISATQVDEYEAVVEALLQDALERHEREKVNGGIDFSWRQIGKAHGISQFIKSKDENEYYRLEGKVRVQLSLLLRTVRASNDDELVARRTALCGDAMDGQTLYLLKDQSQVNGTSQLAIQWEAIAMSSTEKTYRYDMCALDYAGSDQDINGIPMVFKVSHSIHLPQCVSLFESHGLRRLEGTEVMLLRPCPDNTMLTEIVIEGSFSSQHRIDDYVLTSYLEQRCQILGKLADFALAKRLASIPLLDRALWIPTHERKRCCICMYRFHMLSRKLNCQACGDIVCKSCVIARKSVYDGVKKEKSLTTDIKFCKKCVIMATDEEERLAIHVFKAKEIDDQRFSIQDYFHSRNVKSAMNLYAQSAQSYLAKGLAAYHPMNSIAHGTAGIEGPRRLR
uniref:Uncharacterized protein AlNc14C265G9876 n=1 Tax=Albugo laibachii Nc14 TaxID=890382 RepID=F0WU53_9STRA|nr:conserved hypothetical protein [Albugo laibachii Nc14]|eukprot:CCA24930.1 conserved hypothetical protein [Albugo laibachii Nc14]